MFHCQHWEAVAGCTVRVFEDPQHRGYWAVTVLHTHKTTDVAVSDDYGALSWEEAVTTVEAALRAAQPGFRHTRLQALQDRLWPSDPPATM